ncbi:extracellular matrix regulator RemB [Desulfofundulus thermocisternus]|uniref:extracellular matrix regulator RemB n=1 Tax=Desulfofundulus thermocisternus TaxID=42471 RepID=UPI00048A3598|nr:extracellular matrix/biofilm biosynthesis regulator RemA family protein [Desulfofundulus thermocisternus]
MFLHLGNDVVIPKRDIVAILNVRVENSPVNREFMELARSEKIVQVIADKGKEKSIVLTSNRIYVSPISCSTLKKRAGMLVFDGD